MAAVPKIGVVGPGGRIKYVLEYVRRYLPALQVQALCALEEATFADWDDLLAPGALKTLDLDEFIRRSGVDWVFIGSFNHVHARHVVVALAAGKHVFCEKPLATTLEDCLAIRDAVAATDRTFAFGLVLRYAPIYQQVHQWLAEGRLGRLVSFEFNETLTPTHGGYIMGNWRRWRELAGTHVLEKTCHDLDLANWFVGSLPVRVASFGGRTVYRPENRFLETDLGHTDTGKSLYRLWGDPHRVDPFGDDKDINDHQVAILEYANGVRGTFHTNCHTTLPERRFYMLGTTGTIRADCNTSTAEFIPVGYTARKETITFSTNEGHGGGDPAMARHLVKVLTAGAAPLAGIREGLHSAIACFGIDAACDTGTVFDLRPLWSRAGILPE